LANLVGLPDLDAFPDLFDLFGLFGLPASLGPPGLPGLPRLFLPKRASIERFPPLRFGFVPSKVANSFFAGAPPFAPRPFDTRRSSTFPGRALGLRRWAAAPRTVDEFL